MSSPTTPHPSIDPTPEADRPPGAVIDQLTTPSILVRAIASVAVLLALLAGTFVADDYAFPFTPFKMYAGRTDPSGVVDSLRLEGVDAGGTRFAVSSDSVGLRRADFEGTVSELTENPGLLADVATRYDNNNPGKPVLVQLDVIVRTTTLKHGIPTSHVTDTVVATWHRG